MIHDFMNPGKNRSALTSGSTKLLYCHDIKAWSRSRAISSSFSNSNSEFSDIAPYEAGKVVLLSVLLASTTTTVCTQVFTKTL